MLQELYLAMTHKGVNYNSYFWNGEPFTSLQQKRSGMRHRSWVLPVLRSASTFLKCWNRDARSFRPWVSHGYSCTEFKRDARDGVYKLMEVNGRHNRSGLLAVQLWHQLPLDPV